MAFRAGPGIWWFIALSGVGIGCFSVVDNFYFRSSGYSVAMVGVLVAVFNTSVAVAEIPSALVFDRRSHRLAIQLGNAVRMAGLVLFFLALGPGGDIGAEVLAGIGAAAMSGTSNAYVLNRISASDPDAKRRALARIALLGSATTLIGGALGIALFVLWPRLIWLGGAIFMAAAGLVFHVPVERGDRRIDELAHRVNVTWVTPLGVVTDSTVYCCSRPSSPSHNRTPRPSRIGTITTCR